MFIKSIVNFILISNEQLWLHISCILHSIRDNESCSKTLNR